MSVRARLARPEIAAALAVGAFTVLRLAALTRYPFWTDETWTLEVGRSSLRTALMLHADDQTHPPLFYTLLWFWRRVGGDSLVWVRLLPCLAGIATAIPMFAIARAARMSARATWLSLLLGAGSGLLVAYSAELRNYSLLALAGSASLALWLRARDGGTRRDFIALSIANMVLVNTHYFGVFVVMAEWCDALGWARRRLRAMTVSATVAALSLAPWLFETVRRARITGNHLEVVSWIPYPHVGDLLDVVSETLGTTPWPAFDIAAAVVACSAVAIWAVRARHSVAAPGLRLLLLAVMVPVGIAFVASVVGPRPVWLVRYLITVAPPFLLLLGGALDALIPARLAPVAVALALIPGVLTARSLVRGEAKPRFDTVVRTIAAHESAPRIDLLLPGVVEALPVIYAIRGEPALPRQLNARSMEPGARPDVDSGWIVWSDVHSPRGLPPSATLLRQGFAIGPAFGFRSKEDSLVALRFVRKAPR